MTIRRTEQYQFKCDHCGATEIVYAVDPAVEMPEGYVVVPVAELMQWAAAMQEAFEAMEDELRRVFVYLPESEDK
jgi:hypothetical protein